MKALISLILAFLLCFSLVACDSIVDDLLEEVESTESDDKTTENTTQKEDETESEEETSKEASSSKNTLKILSDSMSPTFKAGNVIRYENIEDPKELAVGDIIVYWSVIGGERQKVAHRIVNIYDGGEYLIFETKGDNNAVANPLTIHESEIIGKFVEVVK